MGAIASVREWWVSDGGKGEEVGARDAHGFFRSWRLVDAFACDVVWMTRHDDVAY